MDESPIPRPHLLKYPQHLLNHLSDIPPSLFLNREIDQASTSLLRKFVPQGGKGDIRALHTIRLSNIIPA